MARKDGTVHIGSSLIPTEPNSATPNGTPQEVKEESDDDDDDYDDDDYEPPRR